MDNPVLFVKLKEQSNASKKTIHRLTVNNVVISKQDGIMQAFKDYYANVLEKESIDPSLWQELTENLVRIDSDDSDLCETIISYDDCIKSINSMQDFRSPGCDGLPAEFYKKKFIYPAKILLILSIVKSIRCPALSVLE